MVTTMFGGGKGGILAVEIKDEATLYEHYLSFVEGGAIFVPTKKTYKLGEEIFFLLSIYLQAEPVPMTGKVVWITPKGAGGKRLEGVGVKFGEEQLELRNQIEQALTGTMLSHRPTLTM